MSAKTDEQLALILAMPELPNAHDLMVASGLASGPLTTNNRRQSVIYWKGVHHNKQTWAKIKDAATSTNQHSTINRVDAFYSLHAAGGRRIFWEFDAEGSRPRIKENLDAEAFVFQSILEGVELLDDVPREELKASRDVVEHGLRDEQHTEELSAELMRHRLGEGGSGTVSMSTVALT